MAREEYKFKESSKRGKEKYTFQGREGQNDRWKK